uniref:Orn/Lys/Arg decarboxylase N-terminal domain-containing protein n=1 Tax=Pseudomonas aeruginosa TaxID=287 RepID=UPI002492CE6E
MYKDLKFPVLIVHRDIKADTVAGERVRGIAHELEQDGFSILSTASSAEGRIVASTHHGLACILVAAEGAGENQRLLQDVVELIRVARVRAPQLPIFALGEQVTIENAPPGRPGGRGTARGIRTEERHGVFEQ